MNETLSRALLYGGAFCLLGGLAAVSHFHKADADVSTLLSSADVQLRLAFTNRAGQGDVVTTVAAGASTVAITASVVGVIVNLTLWFALHVVFRRVSDVAFGPLTLTLPEPASFDWKVAVVAVLAALLIFRLRFGIIPTLAASAAAGLALSLV